MLDKQNIFHLPESRSQDVRMKHLLACDILLTGSGGRLAGRLRPVWGAGDTALTTVNVSRGHAGDIRWCPGDPIDALPRCDTIIALWGVTAGDTVALNGNRHLADTAHDLALWLGARRVLHMSSAGVYGPGSNMSETTAQPRPATQYGHAKLHMEQRIAQRAKNSPVAHCCLRLANVVGADSLAAALTAYGPVELDKFPDGGGPVRSYIAPRMLARVLTGLAALPPDRLPKVVNVAARHPVAMADLLQAAGRTISWRNAPAKAVQTVTLDVTRLSSVLPDVALDADAAAMIEDLRMTQAG